jgi:HAD superfamily hydrolase (TIGR01484 family)
VCLDIDDTLSTHGKLTDSAYRSLWDLQRAGFAVVPITGRPAGWCDHFARFWPIDAVVGENGAFSFFMQEGLRRRADTPSQVSPAELRKKLKELESLIVTRFPHARWASDQAYREFDLAIDICEDVPAWSSADIDALLELCHARGARAKLSSIHVNTWFGDYDKNSGFKHLLTIRPDLPQEFDQWLFIGDSPNDEPMFASFKNSVGVANLKKYLARLKTPPQWITAGESGAGFSEMASFLVSTRESRS